MDYTTKYDEGIVDVTLGQSGDISEWNNIISENDLLTWTPEFQTGQLIQIPNKVKPGVKISNYTYNIEGLLTVLENTLGGVTVTEFTVADSPTVIDYYSMKEGETITDMLLNTTGDLVNWDIITNTNEFGTWTPELQTNQKVLNANEITQNNNISLFKRYPLCNNLNIGDLNDKIDDLINNFANVWILRTGYWDDSGLWVDTANWID